MNYPFVSTCNKFFTLPIVLLLALMFISPVLEESVNCLSNARGQYYTSPIYFLGGWGGSPRNPGLRNYKPGDHEKNITILDNETVMDFRLNMIGKVYDDDTKINVLLCMNSKEKPGKVVNLQLLFDYDNDGMTDTTVNFPTYITSKDFKAENATLFPLNHTGEYEDFSGTEEAEVGGRLPGGTVTLRIWRSDQQSDSDLIIYCGAYNRASRASIPYFKGAEEGAKTGDDDYIVEVLAGVIVILALVFLFLKLGGKKNSEREDSRKQGDARRRSKIRRKNGK